MKKFLLIILIGNLILVSCEKIIELELNESDPKYSIVGTINDESGPYSVNVSRTVNYSADEENLINTALVILSDDFGNIDTLVNVGNGDYKTTFIQGVVGRTYKLEVQIEDKIYVQKSFMNYKPDLDSITTVFNEALGGSSGGGPGGGPSGGQGNSTSTTIYSYFTDSISTEDYYRVLYFVKNKPLTLGFNNFTLIDDHLSENPVSYQNIAVSDKIEVGDTVEVELRHIDENTYKYYLTLKDLIDAGFAPQGIPDNPLSSWSNGALGYFSAYTVDRMQVIVEE